MAAAWATASLMRTKRLPKLETFLGLKPELRPMTSEEMEAACRAWAEAA